MKDLRNENSFCDNLENRDGGAIRVVEGKNSSRRHPQKNPLKVLNSVKNKKPSLKISKISKPKRIVSNKNIENQDLSLIFMEIAEKLEKSGNLFI